MKQRALAIAGIWLAACGPRSEPTKVAEAPPGPAEAPAAASTAPTAGPEAPPHAPSSTPTPTPASQAPTAPSIHDVCFAMCDQVKVKCPKSSFEACQLNCGKYEPATADCADVVRAALSCARDAADLVCANVAPESCAKLFRKISACAAGQTPTSEVAASSAALPPDFFVYEQAQEHIVAPMPRGVAAGEGTTLASVKHADGAVYSIRKLPRPAGKLNEKVFLKLGMNLFGRCSDKMKMQGMVDKPGRTSIHYTTKCPDGSEEQGLFWATDKALYVASAKGQAGKLGPTEAFLYGFEVR